MEHKKEILIGDMNKSMHPLKQAKHVHSYCARAMCMHAWFVLYFVDKDLFKKFSLINWGLIYTNCFIKSVCSFLQILLACVNGN